MASALALILVPWGKVAFLAACSSLEIPQSTFQSTGLADVLHKPSAGTTATKAYIWIQTPRIRLSLLWNRRHRTWAGTHPSAPSAVPDPALSGGSEPSASDASHADAAHGDGVCSGEVESSGLASSSPLPIDLMELDACRDGADLGDCSLALAEFGISRAGPYPRPICLTGLAPNWGYWVGSSSDGGAGAALGMRRSVNSLSTPAGGAFFETGGRGPSLGPRAHDGAGLGAALTGRGDLIGAGGGGQTRQSGSFGGAFTILTAGPARPYGGGAGAALTAGDIGSSAFNRIGSGAVPFAIGVRTVPKQIESPADNSESEPEVTCRGAGRVGLLGVSSGKNLGNASVGQLRHSSAHPRSTLPLSLQPPLVTDKFAMAEATSAIFCPLDSWHRAGMMLPFSNSAASWPQ